MVSWREPVPASRTGSYNSSGGAQMSWTLPCTHCKFYIVVGDRGMSGKGMGAGVEAAELMKGHIKIHGKDWQQYLKGLDKNGR